MTGGDGTAFSVNCDESTLTTTGGILAVKDHGIGREKLTERLSGRYYVNTSQTYIIEQGTDTSIPFNSSDWIHDDNNLITITTGNFITGDIFKIKANQEIGLRISACVSIDEWSTPSNGKNMDLCILKGSTKYLLDSIIVQDNSYIAQSEIILSGSSSIYLDTDEELTIVIDNQSGASALLKTGDNYSWISFEEV